MRVGIFFGGQSREREISFAGGRTVYDNLNKNLFEAVPIFVDSLGNFILLDWQYVYKGTIRDFYPPHAYCPPSPNGFQVYIESLGYLNNDELDRIIYSVGQKISPVQFKDLFDIAFLALHGPYGEDGDIQGILEWYGIPYTGSGILPSAIGISKSVQHKFMQHDNFNRPKNFILNKKDWFSAPDKNELMHTYINELSLPIVVKSANQGSSIGITILQDADLVKFIEAINRAFFMLQINKNEWLEKSDEAKVSYIRTLTDIREGIGLPVIADDRQINHPDELLSFMNDHFAHSDMPLFLESIDNEEQILIEGFIRGKEFSCIVVQDEHGEVIALPPTEIVKAADLFDYRSKYLPGMSRKVTPIDLPGEWIEAIRMECQRLFTSLNFNVYARIDGFITFEGAIYLNDPNTTSGMLPSSFFFHQAAEIGMNPSEFLTYIIRQSVAERIKSGKKTYSLKKLLSHLDLQIEKLKNNAEQKIRVAVIMGGFSSERHISVESGRNIYEKMASSKKYEPIPVFLTGNEMDHQMYVLPVNMMLKDNADDIRDKVWSNKPKHPILQEIVKEAGAITGKYVKNYISEARRIYYSDLASMVDVVFIALHGRPGEDGSVQAELDKHNIPYNGSGVQSSQTTINKFETNKILRDNGVLVANSMLVYKQEWEHFYFDLITKIESNFQYPLIAKPSDDGCSSAVKKIKSREELTAYAKLMFGWEGLHEGESSRILNLKFNEEFPQKNYFMIEDIISRDHSKHFLEVTGGLLTRYDEHGNIQYEMFEPSETLAQGEVLSLEEKFLAGEGQNITPARYDRDPGTRQYIADQVKEQLKRAAQLLNVQGYARIDAFVRVFDDNRADVIIIEVNSLPGMTPATCIFHQTAINGYKPYDFIDRILTFGIERRNRKNQELSHSH